MILKKSIRKFQQGGVPLSTGYDTFMPEQTSPTVGQVSPTISPIKQRQVYRPGVGGVNYPDMLKNTIAKQYLDMLEEQALRNLPPIPKVPAPEFKYDYDITSSTTTPIPMEETESYEPEVERAIVGMGAEPLTPKETPKEIKPTPGMIAEKKEPDIKKENIKTGSKGDPYEYKKEGNKYYFRKIGEAKWKTASGMGERAIKTSIFKERDVTPKKMTPKSVKSVGTSTKQSSETETKPTSTSTKKPEKKDYTKNKGI